MTDSPTYVIVHHREDDRGTVDRVHDIHPDPNLGDVSRRASGLQRTANVHHGRLNDTYRVAELRFVDEESR